MREFSVRYSFVVCASQFIFNLGFHKFVCLFSNWGVQLQNAIMFVFFSTSFKHESPEDPKQVPGGFVSDCNTVREEEVT